MKKSFILLLIPLLTLSFAGCAPKSEEDQKEEEVRQETVETVDNEIVLQSEEGIGNTAEFELAFKNMVYSFITARLTAEEFIDLKAVEGEHIDYEQHYTRALSALDRAEKSIEHFEKVVDDLLAENSGNSAFFNLFAPKTVFALNLWDPRQQALTLETGLTEEEKARIAARLHRGAPRGERARVLNHVSQTLGADVHLVRDAMHDLDETWRNLHQNNINTLEHATTALKVADRAGTVAIFGLDVMTGPIPTTMAGRIIYRSVLALKGIDAVLAVGEGVTIAVGNENGEAVLAQARGYLETPLTLISICDVSGQGIKSITEMTNLPGTLRLATDLSMQDPNFVAVDFEKEDGASIEHYYYPNISDLGGEEGQRVMLAQEIRPGMIQLTQGKLDEVVKQMEEAGIEFELKPDHSGLYTGSFVDATQGASMKVPFEININQDGAVTMSFEHSDVVEAGALAGVPGAGGGVYVSITSKGHLSGTVEGSEIKASGTGTGSYSLPGHSESQSYNATMSATIENGVIQGVFDADTGQSKSFTANKVR